VFEGFWFGSDDIRVVKLLSRGLELVNAKTAGPSVPGAREEAFD